MTEHASADRAVADQTAGETAIGPVDVTNAGLTNRDRAVLTFEAEWWKHSGAKEEAIRAEFGYSAARYYQVLGVLIDSPQALVSDPMLIKRLQRMRAERSVARSRRAVPPTR